MTNISVITPLHEKGNPFIEEAMQSLKAQTYQDFEWIVLQNNGGHAPEAVRKYEKTVLSDYFDKPNIGALKAEACDRAFGDIIVELDADDKIAPHTLETIANSLRNGKVFFYSDALELNEDGSPYLYSPHYGWKKGSFFGDGREIEYNISFPVNPSSLRQIFWSPNHVRAWTKRAYRSIGGHDRGLEVGDDHDLIMRFYIKYGEEGFVYHPEPLYTYRVHKNNTFQERVDKIAAQSWNNYHRHMHHILVKWCRDNDLHKLDLGGRLNPTDGMTVVDKHQPCQLQLDLSLEQDWNILEDNSVGYIRAYDFIEHIPDPAVFMQRCYEKLAPGGWMRIAVPSTDGRGAFQDPTHVSFWNLNSFWYYTNPEFAKYISPTFTGKFQVARLEQYFPSEWHKTHNIPYVYADLIALKDNWAIGESLWPRSE